MSHETPSQAPEPSEKPKTTLIVLGKNIGEEWTGDKIRKTHHHLSPHGVVSVLAAGVAIKEGLADEVYFTVGNTTGQEPLSLSDAKLSHDIRGTGLPLPPEAELMAAQFKRIFPKFADKVKTQPNSWDTNTDAKEVKKLIEEKKINPANRLVLMTTGFHLPRAINLFKKQGLKPQTLASEEVLAIRRPKFAEGYKQSPLYKKEEGKEKWVRRIQRLPFAADFITAVTKRSRTS